MPDPGVHGVPRPGVRGLWLRGRLLWLLLPSVAWQIALVRAAVVALSSAQRIVAGYRALS